MRNDKKSVISFTAEYTSLNACLTTRPRPTYGISSTEWISAGASLNESPRSTTIVPQFSGDLFLVITLLNQKSRPVSVVFTRAVFICMGPLRGPF